VLAMVKEETFDGATVQWQPWQENYERDGTTGDSE
jgi:hypothetical protein